MSKRGAACDERCLSVVGSLSIWDAHNSTHMLGRTILSGQPLSGWIPRGFACDVVRVVMTPTTGVQNLCPIARIGHDSASTTQTKYNRNGMLRRQTTRAIMRQGGKQNCACRHSNIPFLQTKRSVAFFRGCCWFFGSADACTTPRRGRGCTHEHRQQ
jgi:hypothetical protein